MFLKEKYDLFLSKSFQIGHKISQYTKIIMGIEPLSVPGD